METLQDQLSKVRSIYPISNITEKVTGDQMAERLAQKAEEVKVTQEQEVLQMLKEKGVNLDTLKAVLSSPEVPGVAAPVMTPGQRLGQGVAKLIKLGKVAAQVAKVQSTSFIEDVKKGYKEAK